MPRWRDETESFTSYGWHEVCVCADCVFYLHQREARRGRRAVKRLLMPPDSRYATPNISISLSLVVKNTGRGSLLLLHVSTYIKVNTECAKNTVGVFLCMKEKGRREEQEEEEGQEEEGKDRQRLEKKSSCRGNMQINS